MASFVVGLFAALSLIAGLLGKVRLFLIVFAAVWLLFAAVTYYDYQVYGSTFELILALPYTGTIFAAMSGAFCIGFVVRSLARWMKTL